MDGSQITGSASSYARKYALNGLFGIDDVKDSDYTDNGKETAKPQQKPTQTAQSVTKCDCCGAEITQFKDSKTGEVVMPLDWAKRSRSRYGKVLCFNCIRNGNN
jgi:ribosomal protein L34E